MIAARVHRLRVRVDEDAPGTVREFTRDRAGAVVNLAFLGAAVAVRPDLDDDVLGRERRNAREPGVEGGACLGRRDGPDEFRPLAGLDVGHGVGRTTGCIWSSRGWGE
ncbi:hypothetical protein N0B31_21345 [Salinirubellus salinus]|uniref:Uncharacterized protein n=1 Tax=Salinirubellus salinus TaxID=1364945 RepID=A0A9E7R2N0_9EURY|nr:hypothetical protein [Salinirubellus salinus]UWM54651.1 hypothetical protein N0B31_21345 [Salinirubellus salinus]